MKSKHWFILKINYSINLFLSSYPLFESLHTLDLHESPVTYCDYITEPNAVFYQNLLRLQSKQTPKRTFSQQVCFTNCSILINKGRLCKRSEY